MAITVYGAGDDLIEVDGDISAEFPLHNDAPEAGDLLAFSDGTILRIAFTRHGTWRITPLVRGAGQLTIEQATEGDCHSDTATLSGAVWVVQGIGHALAVPTCPTN